MRIREYAPSDLADLRRLHSAQGFGYPFPDIDNPLFLSKLVMEEDNEDAAPGREEGHLNSLPDDSSQRRSPRIVMAVLQRLTAEAYLLHDSAAGTPRLRWERFLAMHDAARQDAQARGLQDVQAFLPPSVARAFGRRLTRLGWVQDPWACFTRQTF
jgi:hypothetical protein